MFAWWKMEGRGRDVRAAAQHALLRARWGRPRNGPDLDLHRAGVTRLDVSQATGNGNEATVSRYALPSWGHQQHHLAGIPTRPECPARVYWDGQQWHMPPPPPKHRKPPGWVVGILVVGLIVGGVFLIR
jgi:hypothetical protein